MKVHDLVVLINNKNKQYEINRTQNKCTRDIAKYVFFNNTEFSRII